MTFYFCQHCRRWGLPSQWTLVRGDKRFVLCTECANGLRRRKDHTASVHSLEIYPIRITVDVHTSKP